MSNLFASGQIIDIILLLMVVEGIALAGVHARTGRGLPVTQLVITLLPGAALMIAVRAALIDMGWIAVAACLLAALAFHFADLRSRWR